MHEEKVAKLKQEAAFCREAASHMSLKAVKETFLESARAYERHAAALEALRSPT